MANETNLTYSEDYYEGNFSTEIFDEHYTNYTNLITFPSSDAPSQTPTMHVQLRSEPWVIPLLVLSSLNLLAIICFEVYVLYKSCGSKRHLFLGQTLLLALFFCSFLGYAYTLTAHWLICGFTRAGLGLVYVLMFATLLTKCLFLLGLHSGTFLTSSYQSLLIFFAFGVQIVIATQWLAYKVPELVISDEEPYNKVCNAPPLERVSYLSYVIVLILMLCIAAIRGRSLKENNNEAKYIGVAVGILVVIWVSWMTVVVIFERRHEDAAEGFGVVCSSLVVFLLVFVPKAVQLSSAHSKEGSATGSQSMAYPPSFFQLQPHAILPSTGDGSSTIIKPRSSVPDHCRGYSPRIWRYDYPIFYEMEPPPLTNSVGSSQHKSNTSFARKSTN